MEESVGGEPGDVAVGVPPVLVLFDALLPVPTAAVPSPSPPPHAVSSSTVLATLANQTCLPRMFHPVFQSLKIDTA
nr:hypothetical protein [Burkholderia stabilis]